MKFLVVDDETLIRRSLARALQASGHECHEAENGAEGLQKLSSEKYDGLILDLIMPLKSGYDVIAEFKDEIPIFIISAFSGPQLSADYLKSDARIKSVLKKPFDNLFQIVELILAEVEMKKVKP